MSKSKPAKPLTASVQPHTQKPKPTEVAPKPFHIASPLLWLLLATLAVYGVSATFGLTDLDDTIFIRDFHVFNEDLGNLFVAFQRGLFDAVKDPYYRPLFLDSMILNYQLSNGGEVVVSYHIVNILIHCANVALIYVLFTKLDFRKTTAFVLALLFAVHPVLSQAVAWIPGRNDTMLALFALPFFIQCVNYSDTGKAKALVLSTLFLLLSFFTKETAVVLPAIAAILLLALRTANWRGQRMLTLYSCWACCTGVWFFARHAAVPQSAGIQVGVLLTDGLHRLPLIAQYLGKIFFPFNLNVFPIVEDTVMYYGLAAIILFTVGIFLNKKRNLRILLSGLAIFITLLLPVLFVPNNLNEQTFEHRLYLPFLGILIVATQMRFGNATFSDKQIFTGGIVLAFFLGVINVVHQQDFSNAKKFWSAAVAGSPHSAYANMMLGARTDDLPISDSLFRKAYRLNPNEKYLNYYMGVLLQKEDSIAQSEPYLLREKNTSGYYESDFYLARAAMQNKDFPTAINCLRTYVTMDRHNKVAQTNLLLMYLDTKQPDSARVQAQKMQGLGMPVPQQIMQQLGM